MVHGELKTRIESFEKSINIDLFNATLALAANTSQDENVMKLYRKTDNELIWGDRAIDWEAFFAPYNLRYLGEILERYQDCFGPEKRNYRAVALALGYAAPFITPSMFIGNQKIVFLQKLEKETEQDIYLMGAKYLLASDTVKQKEILENLTQITYSNTEEAMFILSLYEDPVEGFKAMRTQLSRLWGTDRSLSLISNAGILEWLIKKYIAVIKGDRKMDSAVLRALCKLPCMFAKQETPVYATLAAAGYTGLEIAYANSDMVWASGIQDRLNPDGITAEKIAAEFCIVAINNAAALDEKLYEYLGWLLIKYGTFQIKYQENKGIWEAIQERLEPTQPQTVLWMIQNIKASFPYRFDVFSSRWDILAQELETERYRELFTEQLIHQTEKSPEVVDKWLARYQELTKLDYTATCFKSFHYDFRSSFALMVETGKIQLWQLFKDNRSFDKKENEDSAELHYLKEYIKSANTREAFDFWQQILEDYDFTELGCFFGTWYKFHEGFANALRPTYREDTTLDFHRKFLAPEEERQLFGWIDESVFRTEPENYFAFVRAALKNETVQEIFDREYLCNTLKALIASGNIAEYESRPLKEKYFAPDDMKADQEAAEAAREEEKQKKELKDWEYKRNKLAETYDGSFESLRKYIKSFWASGEKKKAISLIDGLMAKLVANTVKPVSSEELGEFFHLCGHIVKLSALPWSTLYPLIQTMIKEGVDTDDVKAD